MFIAIQEADFCQAELYQQLRRSSRDAGAIVTFTGLVRDHNPHGKINGLSLEHYPGMTEKALSSLVTGAITQFELTDAAAVHRVGRLHNDEQIVWVGCAALHRRAAFEGAMYIMDMLKQSVPLWKKEFVGEQGHWVAPKASDDAAALAWLSNKKE
ncbi:molybdenum cofactor biosynthesis protein MoaE [Salinimonas lutimaris]|uniref:molybdenum cofactor biosynthesis protein MoaE n=1 Tax=Salinimonas lutimaris TaxID=914153 RepID=UPI0010BFF7ED|nr:molybdenum cofactor biosynthesis protein MoaE [Salinimonas lutimaris]